jgi:hypothetical protein
MPTPEQRQALMDNLRQLPDQLAALVNGLTDAQLDTHFLPHEWSVRQNVHHVFDSHVNAYIRTKQLLTKSHPTIMPYDQDAWALMPDYSLPIEVSLTLIRMLHLRWVAVFESLSEKQFARTGIHPESGEISVDSLLQTYSDHGKAHLDQITRTLAAEKSI